MDRPKPDLEDLHWLGPWRFYAHRYGFRNVVTDRDGRYLVSGVPVVCGPLLAAGPQLLDTLERITASSEPGTPVHELAVGTVESFREREGVVLADWRAYQPSPQLRIVGVVT